MISIDKNFPRTGTTQDLYKYLDELACLNIIKYHKTFRHFETYINLKTIKNIINIRHECVHVFQSGKLFKRSLADDTLMQMACAMEKIDKDVQQAILKLRSQLSTDTIKTNPVIASKETLIHFLKDRVWDKSKMLLDGTASIEKQEAENIKSNMNNSIAFITNELQTATDLVNWFNKHLSSPEGIKMYLKLKSIPDISIPTFEDVRFDFYTLCYGEYK